MSQGMQRQYIKWYSPSLHREMELLAFGDRGFPVLVFPTSGGRFFEYEDRGMVNALRPKIDRGELQVICVDSVDQESWYNRSIHPADRLHRQNAFDAYLANEVAPFVRNRTSWPRMGTTGCSFGGYHAINFALRHPDLVTYAVSMSGAFDIPQRFLNGHYDDNAYLHSPARLPARPLRPVVPGTHSQQLLRAGGRQPGSAVRSERKTGACFRQPAEFRTCWTCGKALATIGHGGTRWRRSFSFEETAWQESACSTEWKNRFRRHWWITSMREA